MQQGVNAWSSLSFGVGELVTRCDLTGEGREVEFPARAIGGRVAVAGGAVRTRGSFAHHQVPGSELRQVILLVMELGVALHQDLDPESLA